ncbi:MAG: serine/threonine-protein kinase [Myxococcota bacterium]
MPSPLEQRRYKILHVLGKGGFGTVYKAELQAAGGFAKEVALKVLNPELQGDEGVVMRLRDEARMLGLLRHRAIVQVDGLVKLDDRWTIVMEFVNGASLRDLLSLGPFPVSAALEVCEEVAAALDMAYAGEAAGGKALGLLHRDIKPGNIQITDRGEVKLLDFGVAKADFGAREAETRSLIFGSLNYMAPERMDFEDTHKGDVYALACCLYEMLTGEQLAKASINPRKQRDRVQKAKVRILQMHNDPDLAELVERSLDYEPDLRPDARHFERRARAIRRGYPEPWLRDWSETAVPRAQASRSLTEDDWTGSLVNESGVLAQPTLALFREDVDSVADETLPPPSSTAGRHAPPEQQPRPRPPTPKPKPPPSPTAKTWAPDTVMTANAPPLPTRRRSKPKRRSRVGRWILGTVIALFFLVLAAIVLIPVAAGTGLWALLQGSGIMAEAWAETVQDDMVELDQLVAKCNATLERKDVRTLLKQGHNPDVAQRISLIELVNIQNLVEDAAADGHISEIELDKIQSSWKQITKD